MLHCLINLCEISGGHTSEALMLISGLDFSRYSPRIYIVSDGDILSTNKAISLERSKASPVRVILFRPFYLSRPHVFSDS